MKEKFFLALMETQNAHWELSRKGFQQLELTDGQPKILYILQNMEGCMQKDLAAVCRIRPSTLTVALERMEKQGYIYKEERKLLGGKRAYGIFLTKDGRKKAEQVNELVEILEEKSLSGFSEEEQDALFSYLARIRKNLAQQDPVSV